MMFADCISEDQLLAHNKYRGAYHYIDPLTQVFCVHYNNAPLVGDYWVERKMVDNEDIEEMAKSPFLKAIYGYDRFTSTNIDSSIYQLGDPMKSQVNDGTNTVNREVRLPKPDLNGYCNNNYAARFMEGAINSCEQAVDLSDEKDCTTVLNAQYWTDYLKVVSGVTTSIQTVDVQHSSNYFTHDQTTGAYSAVTGVPPASTFSGNACTNALKEVVYDVYVKTMPAEQGVSQTAFYAID